MATTDTVLQPGAEDLSGFTGPAGPTGPQGVIGVTGAGIDLNMLSIKCQYINMGGIIQLVPANFTKTYLYEYGSKFIANGAASHTWTTDLSVPGSYFAGSLSNFLVTPTTTAGYNVLVTKNRQILSGTTQAPALNNATMFDIEIYDQTNSSFAWRLFWNHGYSGGQTATLNNIQGNVSDFEFSLIITA